MNTIKSHSYPLPFPTGHGYTIKNILSFVILDRSIFFQPRLSIQTLPDLKKKKQTVVAGVPVVAQWVQNLTSSHEDAGSISDPAQLVKDLVLL